MKRTVIMMPVAIEYSLENGEWKVQVIPPTDEQAKLAFESQLITQAVTDYFGPSTKIAGICLKRLYLYDSVTRSTWEVNYKMVNGQYSFYKD